MKRFISHILLPMTMPLVFLVVATTPVEVLGCRTRGLLALLLTFASGLAALAAVIKALKERQRSETETLWWVASAMILVIPVVALIILA
jgi:hypothetical protein